LIIHLTPEPPLQCIEGPGWKGLAKEQVSSLA
jgi:hypothetical protein